MKAHSKKIYRGISKFIDKFIQDNTLSMAAALAYYAALSLAPLLILFLSLAAQLKLSVQQNFITEVEALIGDRAAEAIEMIISAAKDRQDLKGLSGLFGALTLAVSSSAVFIELKSSLNRIVEAPAPVTAEQSNFAVVMTFLKDRLLNVGFVLSFLFILLISLILSTLLTIYLPEGSQGGARAISVVFTFAAQFILFSLLYRYVPDKRQDWRHSFFSGCITTILFVTGKEAVGFYLGRSGVGSAYGAAGSVIVLLIWVYYTALIVFSGAQISYLLTNKKRFPPLTPQLATQEKPHEA